MSIQDSNTPTNLWLVFGSCGEYSDFTRWAVCAYRTEAEAQKHAALAAARAASLRQEYTHYYAIPANANEYDPQMRCDYTGTDYAHEMIELRELK